MSYKARMKRAGGGKIYGWRGEVWGQTGPASSPLTLPMTWANTCSASALCWDTWLRVRWNSSCREYPALWRRVKKLAARTQGSAPNQYTETPTFQALT